MVWGGLRGALAMVLALALPAEIPQRTLLIDMTLGVVVASLLIQGLTISFVAGRLTTHGGLDRELRGEGLRVEG